MDDSILICSELGLYARRMCSSIFLNGSEPEVAFENNSGPSGILHELKYDVDWAHRRVSITYNNKTRKAQFFDDQGSVVLPEGEDVVFFEPVEVISILPDAKSTHWPMGDLIEEKPLKSELDIALVNEAIDSAFNHPSNLTAAVVVLHKGEIVGERYESGINEDTQLESWSMGKSLLASVFARLVFDGTYEIDQPVPVPEWREPGDPRGKITIRDLLQMSSGLKFSSASDPDYIRDKGIPDHGRAYTDSINIYEFSRSRELELPAPRWTGRYHNCDPWVLGSLIKDAAVARGADYLTFPQRELFDLIGIRKQVIETDPYGNLIFTGCDYGTARNWARLGLLYLQDGIWNGKRVLPEGWTDFVSSPAPKWEKEEYGGLFWLNRQSRFPMLPEKTYYAAGAGHQYTLIVPEHQMVIVRMGYSLYQKLVREEKESASFQSVGPDQSLERMLELLMKALPSK